MIQQHRLHDEFLQEYADNELDSATRLAVSRELPASAPDLATVEAYHTQRELLHQIYDEVLEEDVPARLTAVLDACPNIHAESASSRDARAGTATNPWRRGGIAAAAAVVLVVLGAVGGWTLHGELYIRDSRQRALDAFLHNATNAYALYGNQASPWFSSTVGKLDEFVASFKKTAGVSIAAPNLTGSGWEFEQARALPSETGPAGQLLYHDGNGQRLAIYFQVSDGGASGLRPAVSQQTKKASAVQRSFTTRDELSVYYWDAGPISYAVLGKLQKNTLSSLLDTIFSGFRT